MSKPALFWNATSSSLDTEDVKVSEVLVHPLVLLSVLDHHTRRQEGAGRVIGTLLGRREGTKVCPSEVFLYIQKIYNNNDVLFLLYLYFIQISWIET